MAQSAEFNMDRAPKYHEAIGDTKLAYLTFPIAVKPKRTTVRRVKTWRQTTQRAHLQVRDLRAGAGSAYVLPHTPPYSKKAFPGQIVMYDVYADRCQRKPNASRCTTNLAHTDCVIPAGYNATTAGMDGRIPWDYSPYQWESCNDGDILTEWDTLSTTRYHFAGISITTTTQMQSVMDPADTKDKMANKLTYHFGGTAMVNTFNHQRIRAGSALYADFPTDAEIDWIDRNDQIPSMMKPFWPFVARPFSQMRAYRPYLDEDAMRAREIGYAITGSPAFGAVLAQIR